MTPVLVDTATAAEAAGVSPANFLRWARLRDITPARYERRGRSTHALYDLDQVFEGTKHKRKKPTRRHEGAGQDAAG